MSEYKRKSTASKLSKRKPWQRLDVALKNRIVREIKSGSIGFREASRKYNVHRTMLTRWLEKTVIIDLIDNKQAAPINTLYSEMTERKVDSELLLKVRALTKELEYSKLKIEGLETMIVVAEEELKIKIRKKRGTKQSKECGKVSPK